MVSIEHRLGTILVAHYANLIEMPPSAIIALPVTNAETTVFPAMDKGFESA